MRTGIIVVAIVMDLTAMSMRAEALGGASCMIVANTGVSFGDAATTVQELRTTLAASEGGPVLPKQQRQLLLRAALLVMSSNVAATTCGPFNYCASCADVGNSLNAVLAQCNVLNEVQGVFSLDCTSQELFYLTSASNHP